MLEQAKILLWKNFKFWCNYKIVFIGSFANFMLYVGHGTEKEWKPVNKVIPQSRMPPILLHLSQSEAPSMSLPYAPKSPATDDLMRLLLNMSGVGKTIAFKDKESADKSLSSENETPDRLPFIYFTNVEANSTTMPSQLSVSIGIYQDSQSRYVLQLNILIATAFINYHRLSNSLEPVTFDISGQLIPTKAGMKRDASKLRQYLIYFPVAFIYHWWGVFGLFMGDEKTAKIKQTMKLMGVSTGLYWCVWFISGFICTLPLLVYATGVWHLEKMISPTNPVVFYIWAQVFVINYMSFVYLVITVCGGEETASQLIFGIFAFPVIASIILSLKLTNRSLVLLLNILLFPHAFYVGAEPFTVMIERDGYDFTNLMTAIDSDGEPGYSLLDSILGMIYNTLVYTFLLWYIDSVYPGEYGIPQPHLFCFMPSYWTGKPTSYKGANIELPPQDELYFEEEPQGLEVGLQVHNLVKVYGNSVVVKGINMSIYKNQITVLLGHNGAGKTTTLEMIAGMVRPTKGTAIINGYDLRTQTYQALKCVGLCSQHERLYEFALTCGEHLRLFLTLRGQTTDVKSTCRDLLRKVGLWDKENEMVETLSKGQRRKLSLAIALIGSKVVILDEPSEGLDPSARREMCNILQSIRDDRTILLTTHNMDEAEILGDRIAIMANGVVKCCGTAAFLKHLYGTGYQLNVETLPDCKTDKVTTFLQNILPGTKFVGSTHTELQFILPEEELESFSTLFEQLEENVDKLGISSFNISATSMEDVFIKVGEGIEPKNSGVRTADEKENKDNSDESKVDVKAATGPDSTEKDANQRSFNESGSEMTTELFGYTLNRGTKRKLQQMKAILIKRLILTKREWIATVCYYILLPVAAMFLALYIKKTSDEAPQTGSQAVQLKPFGNKSTVNVWGHPGVDDQLITAYMDQFSGTSDKAVRVTETMNVQEYYLVKGVGMELDVFTYTFVTAAEFMVVNDTYVRANALYGKREQADKVSVKLLLEALIKYYLGKETSQFSSEITCQTLEAKKTHHGTFHVEAMLFLGFAMSQLPVLLICQFLKEKQTGARHLQASSGIDPVTFWILNFFYHLSLYMITVACILMAMWLGEAETYIYGGRGWVVLIALVLHGFAIMPNAYFFQILCKSPDQNVVITLFMFAGAILAALQRYWEHLERQSDDKESTEHSDYIIPLISVMSYVSPIYQLSTILYVLHYTNVLVGDRATNSSFLLRSPEIQDALIKMAAQCVCYFLLLFVVDYKLLRRIRYKFLPSENIEYIKDTCKTEESADPPDDDVIVEKQKVQDTPIQKLCEENHLIIKNVSKAFAQKIAVENIHLSLAQNECFCLVGQSGAGKTTLFKMLTGEMVMSAGDIYFLCRNVKTSLNSILDHVGYCPQYDALDDLLTGRETLYLYGRLRGVPEKNLKDVTRKLMEDLTMTPHADKPTCHYSGGTRRKLSVCISVIGNPDFILLDEPTAGIDLGARRGVWDLLRDLTGAGKTILMTTQIMEECEALCTRLAIMISGKLRCIGNFQYLKNKFNLGWSIYVKMISDKENMDARAEFLGWVTNSFSGCTITENSPDVVNFIVPGKDIKWSTVFRKMEYARTHFYVNTYFVQQTTLVQTYVMFVRGGKPHTSGTLSLSQWVFSILEQLCEL